MKQRSPHLSRVAILLAWLILQTPACAARCVDGSRRCRGFTLQLCRNGEWYDERLIRSPWSPRIDSDRCELFLKYRIENEDAE